MHPEGLARTERLHSTSTKLTCHTLKHAVSMQTSFLFMYLTEHSYQRKRERHYRWRYVRNVASLLVYPGDLGGSVRVTPAFPFYTLINVALSSKCNCNRSYQP